MKKNKMMRFASLVLVLTLLSTCAISGTFAKYTTSTSGADSARVAKWGVSVAIEGATRLFADSYAKHDEKVTDAGITNSVTTSGSAGDAVVAPGTSGSMTFSIDGTPEVAVAVSVTFDGATGDTDDLSMITLPGTGEGAEAYHPIKWTLKKSSTTTNDWSKVTAESGLSDVNLEKIEDYFTDATNGINGNYAPNTNLAEKFGYYQLSWEWTFYTDEATDEKDTQLGNYAASSTTLPNGVVLTERLGLVIDVTQID